MTIKTMTAIRKTKEAQRRDFEKINKKFKMIYSIKSHYISYIRCICQVSTKFWVHSMHFDKSYVQKIERW